MADQDYETLAARVRAMQDALFPNDRLGNRHRKVFRERLGELESRRAAARDTRSALLEAVMADHTLSGIRLANLARQQPHAALMYIALDTANTSLMGGIPGEPDGLRDQIAKEVRSFGNAPIRLMMELVSHFG